MTTEGSAMGDLALNARQIALLRDFRSSGFLAFFDSPFRLEGPGLREIGAIAGIGDSTHISEIGMRALSEADAKLRTTIATSKGAPA